MFKGVVLRYLISDALSLLGNSIVGVVLPLVLLSRTGDVLAAGSLALICAVPQFVCGILGGALLDRADRKLVCVVSDLISALSVALLPIIDATAGLSFGWFVALGLLGAVGDVPGMTARDALLPEVCEREGVDLQRFVGASQTLNALVGIAGPAAATLLIGLMNDVDALWVTAACSCAAVAVSATLPHGVGGVKRSVASETVASAQADSSAQRDAVSCTSTSVQRNTAPTDTAALEVPTHRAGMPKLETANSQPGSLAQEPADANLSRSAPKSAPTHTGTSAPEAPSTRFGGIIALGRSILTDGLRALFANSRLLRATTLLSFGITMVMAGLQGIVLPVYFTGSGQPELAGVFISTMAVGMLLGSLVYTAFSSRLSRRGWFCLSLVGMAAGVIGMGTLPPVPLLLASAGAIGLFSGPASALLGFFAYERIPEERRGSAMGTLNALYLIVAPAGTFLGSALIAGVGIERTFPVLAALWVAVTVAALAAPALRNLEADV